MSKYTQTIKSILMENRHTGESISNLEDIYAIASRAIFDVAPMTVISPDYRERLITGFTLHFMNDEIGLETPLLFKLGLADKVYNNAEYINSIFANLDNQIFSDYDTKAVSGTSRDVIDDGLTESTSESGTNSKSGADTLKITGSSNDAHTGSDSLAKTGAVTNTKSGTDTVSHTGQTSDAKGGSNTTTGHNSDSLTKKGSETTTYNEATSNINNSDNLTVGGEKSHETTSNADSSKSNSGSFFQDTPMNNLMTMRQTRTTPAQTYDATGKGIQAAAESAMNYLTNATLSDGTVMNEGQVTVDRDSTESQTRTTDTSANTGTHTGTQSLGFNNREDERIADSSLTEQFGETNTKSVNLSDATSYNSQEQQSSNTVDTTTYNSNMAHTDNRQNKQEYDSSVATSNTGSRTSNRDTTKDTTNSVNETSTKLNLEMIYRSMPLLNKIWEMFDELFMSIY